MRKIEIKAKDAFFAGLEFKQGNTEVRVSRNEVRYYLHGNLIARRLADSLNTYCTLAGWNTSTTKSRLRSLGANIVQRKGVLSVDCEIINDCQWFSI